MAENTSEASASHSSTYDISSDELHNALSSLENARLVIEHIQKPGSLENIDPQTVFKSLLFQVTKVNTFLSELQPSKPETSQHKVANAACMDFLIKSGIEKVIQGVVKEISTFETPEARLMQQYLARPEFVEWLNRFLDATSDIISKQPAFMDNFEINVRKRFLGLVIGDVQKSIKDNLRQQFGLV